MWNYRVIRKTTRIDNKRFNFLGIHEVYYYKSGKIMAYTKEPMCPGGETKAELAKDLSIMLEALDRPILNWSDLQKIKTKRMRRSKNGV